ncbi:HK97 family phage prohead protease [Saccharopolyspora sp. WRP15-2]|uniref:HK97 family phage prohead protease n=1 Tax=Saccharopolyspora oryzae TaxID=2997343 RepID=A0ABT4URH2_9PSEU|nr:HK97 family phage prohead protease [Saccharopolyspora oryzae]MDA3624259.1 HK97 family phage prohead protease [Saccharopolyspora oryzae]
MNTKSFGPIEVKDAAAGEVEAVFSRFGVRDHDGDVTLKEAFTHGHPVKISAYNHGSWEGSLPVGKGQIEVHDDRAVLKGRFFLNTTAGRETFEVVKELGELGEWSYGFTVADFEQGEFEGKSARFLKKLNVYEVSPVLKGAGIGTQTLSVKSQGASFAGQCEQVLTALQELTSRGAEVLAKRREAGKGLGSESRDLLLKVSDELECLKHLLVEPAPEPESEGSDDELLREYLRWVGSQHGLAS